MNLEQNHEIEQTPEMENLPDYQALIVLGGGYSEETDPKSGLKRLILNQDTRVRATASGILVEALNIPEVIYTGGKIAGPNNPSVAAAMYEYAKRLYPDLEDRKVVLEGESWDTSTNAEYVSEILAQENITGSTILLSSGYHLPRADNFFLQRGIDATPMAAEEIVATRSPHHKKYIEKKLASLGNLKAEVMETILRSMLIFDPTGKIPRDMTKKRLENNEVK
jgi:uncharacterized SAM-binding protein YcdF (DUF218 family)